MRNILATVISLLLLNAGYAQEPSENETWSLKECVEYSLQHSEDIAQSVNDQREADYQVQEVTSRGLPQLSGFGNFDYYPSLATQILPGEIVGKPGEEIPVKFGTKYNIQGGLTVNQLLFDQSFFVGLKAAKSSQDLYRLRKNMAEEDVIYNVASAYYQILQTREQLKSVEANLAKLEELVKIMQLQYKNDLVKRVDLTRVQVNKTNLENQRQNFVTAIERQENMLKFFMGMPIDAPIALDNAELAFDITLPGTEDITRISHERTQYKVLEKQRELTTYNIKNYKAGYYPTLSVMGQYVYQAQRNETDFFSGQKPWFNTTQIGFQLNIPIFDGMKKRAQVKQSEMQIKNMELDMQKFQKNTRVEILNATNQLGNSLKSIQEQKDNVALAEEVYHTTNDLYKEGLSPLTDLLDAEASLRESQNNLNNEILKYKIAQLDYDRAQGILKSIIQ